MSTAGPSLERQLSNKDERDEDRLAQFGYQQELRRDWGLAHNFGVSFSIIVRSGPSNSSVQSGRAGWILTRQWN